MHQCVHVGLYQHTLAPNYLSGKFFIGRGGTRNTVGGDGARAITCDWTNNGIGHPGGDRFVEQFTNNDGWYMIGMGDWWYAEQEGCCWCSRDCRLRVVAMNVGHINVGCRDWCFSSAMCLRCGLPGRATIGAAGCVGKDY